MTKDEAYTAELEISMECKDKHLYYSNLQMLVWPKSYKNVILHTHNWRPLLEKASMDQHNEAMKATKETEIQP